MRPAGGASADRRETADPQSIDGSRQPSETLEREGLVNIGVVAARIGVSERTLRYYEEIGLLHPAAHFPGSSRRYCEADVARVRHIRDLQTLMGFNLEEIRAVVSAEDQLDVLRDRYRSTLSSTDRRQMLQEGLGIIEGLQAQVTAKLDRLEAFRVELVAKISRHRETLASLAREDDGGNDHPTG